MDGKALQARHLYDAEREATKTSCLNYQSDFIQIYPFCTVYKPQRCKSHLVPWPSALLPWGRAAPCPAAALSAPGTPRRGCPPACSAPARPSRTRGPAARWSAAAAWPAAACCAPGSPSACPVAGSGQSGPQPRAPNYENQTEVVKG